MFLLPDCLAGARLWDAPQLVCGHGALPPCLVGAHIHGVPPCLFCGRAHWRSMRCSRLFRELACSWGAPPHGLLAGFDEFFKDGQSLLAADAVVGQYLPHVVQGLEHASPHSHGVRKDGRQHQVRCYLLSAGRGVLPIVRALYEVLPPIVSQACSLMGALCYWFSAGPPAHDPQLSCPNACGHARL